MMKKHSLDICMINLIVILLLFISCDAKFIDPSRLLVATVIDSKSNQIIRDSHFLFRSIRQFGGTLNKATIVACIVVEPDIAFINDELLSEYSKLGIHVDFIRQTPSPFPKTLNKFATFYKYDSDRYDHFLWLDADIIFLGDPLLSLPDLENNKIYCVPEVYNYMKRFSLVNTSDIVWNPKLSPFRLLQEDNAVSHGVCNTGVLLFDSISLQSFLNELFHKRHLQNFNSYIEDRFIDSLAFVIAVHAASIRVVPLDYKFNFMAFFELTLKLHGFTQSPLLVHFIHDTSLMFNIRDDGTCYYFYACSHLHSVTEVNKMSIVVKQILQIFDTVTESGAFNCMVMVGKISPPTCEPMKKMASYSTGSDNMPSSQSGIRNKEARMEVVWPVDSSRLFVTKDMIEIDIIIKHSKYHLLSQDNSTLLKLYFVVHLSEVMTDDGVKVAESTSCNLDNNICHSLFTFSYWFDVSLSHSFIYNFIANTYHENKDDDNMSLYEQFRSEEEDNSPSINASESTGSINYEIVFLGFIPENIKGSRMNSNYQHFNGAMLISLQSQIYLSTFLNVRHAVDMGVILCCDTAKGVAATRGIISGWGEEVVHDDIINIAIPKGGILLISLTSTPAGQDEKYLDILQNDLSDYCKNARGKHLSGCVIIRDTNNIKSVLNQNEFYYRQNYLSFVYIDSFVSREKYEKSLNYWYDKLGSGGVLIGSRYHMPVRKPDFIEIILSLPSSLFIKEVVDNFAYVKKIPLLMTYAETPVSGSDQSWPTHDGLLSMFSEILPAWYMLKY